MERPPAMAAETPSEVPMWWSCESLIITGRDSTTIETCKKKKSNSTHCLEPFYRKKHANFGKNIFSSKILNFCFTAQFTLDELNTAPYGARRPQRSLWCWTFSCQNIWTIYSFRLIHKPQITSFIFLSQLFNEYTFRVYPGHWNFISKWSISFQCEEINWWILTPTWRIYSFSFYWKYQTIQNEPSVVK